MAELWWVEALIPADREPDWTAACKRIEELTLADFDEVDEDEWEGFVSQLDPTRLEEHRPKLTTEGIDLRDPWNVALLMPLVKKLIHQQLVEVASLFRESPRPTICTGEAFGVRFYVYCQGHGQEPDPLCEAWYQLWNLGVLSVAGFEQGRPVSPFASYPAKPRPEALA